MSGTRPAHAVKIGASKWCLGVALCGRTIGRLTPTSRDPAGVTCPACRARLAAAPAAPAGGDRP